MRLASTLCALGLVIALVLVLAVRVIMAPIPLPSPPVQQVKEMHPLVERILAFDANRDGLVSPNEVVERMRGFVIAEDANGDGSLDRDEIREAIRAREIRSALDRHRRAITVPRRSTPSLAAIVGDLRLTPPKHEQVLAAAASCPNALFSAGDRARFINAVRSLLTPEERENLIAALDRAGTVRVG
jgi:hypothetical protein